MSTAELPAIGRRTNIDDMIRLRDEEIVKLKSLNESFRVDAEKYRKLLAQADATADYCIDQATDDYGNVVPGRRDVDPGLGGDEFIMVRRRRNDFVVELKSTVMVVRNTDI